MVTTTLAHILSSSSPNQEKGEGNWELPCNFLSKRHSAPRRDPLKPSFGQIEGKREIWGFEANSYSSQWLRTVSSHEERRGKSQHNQPVVVDDAPAAFVSSRFSQFGYDEELAKNKEWEEVKAWVSRAQEKERKRKGKENKIIYEYLKATGR